jgi:hypothetical protein
MNTKIYIAIACSFVISKLHADSSQTSGPESATLAPEQTPHFGVVDLRSIVGNALSVAPETLNLVWGGMNASGSIWGSIIVSNRQTDSFVLHPDGTAQRFVMPQSTDRGGDIPVPRSAVVHGVSAAGEIAYSLGNDSFVSYPSGVTQQFVIEGTAYARPIGMSENGTVAYIAERNGVSVFGQSNSLAIDEVEIDTAEYWFNGYEGLGYAAGAQHSSYSNGYSAFLKAGGELINPFPLMTAQVVDVSGGGILGVRHEFDPSWGYSFTVDSPASVWVSSGATRIEGVIRSGSELISLTSQQNFSVPFALSSDGRTAVGMSFNSIQQFEETGLGTFSLWRDGTHVPVLVESDRVRSVHDAVGIADSGNIAARIVGTDGAQSIGLAVQRPQAMYSREVPSLALDTSSLAVITADGYVPVNRETLAGKRVVVLAHGWAPGAAADGATVAPAWESHAQWYTRIASSLHTEDPDVVVIGYDWMEGAATESKLTPRLSRANTDVAGYVLGMTLKEVAHNAASIEVIGHSHGSRVAVKAAAALEEVGVPVASITLLDSPESPQSVAGVVSSLSGGENLLQRDLAAYGLRFGIGEGESATKIVNVYSSIGEAYNVAGVINAHLVAYDSIESGHSYPIDWFANGGRVPSSDGTYVQDATTHELVPVFQELNSESISITMSRAASVFASDSVEHISKATLYSLDARNAPSSHRSLSLDVTTSTWEALLFVPTGSTEITVPYRFVQASDDTTVSVWLGGELGGQSLAAAANYAPTAIDHTLESIGSDDGWRLLTVSTVGKRGSMSFGLSFDGYGSVEIGEVSTRAQSFSVASTPEPTRAVLSAIGLIVLMVRRYRTA